MSNIRRAYSALIRKDEVGRPKSALYELPNPDYVYGLASGENIEGAKEVTSSWKIHTPSKNPYPKKNFRSLNKMSIKIGLSTPKNFRQFTKANDVRVNRPVGSHLVGLLLPEEQFRYGNPNRPSTPIKSVIYNEYGNDAASQLEDIYKERIVETFQPTGPRPRTTKTIELKKEVTEKKLQEINDYGPKTSMFKMAKFQNPKAKVDTVNRNYVPARSKRPQTASTRSIRRAA